jgi:hypothetical protein
MQGRRWLREVSWGVWRIEHGIRWLRDLKCAVWSARCASITEDIVVHRCGIVHRYGGAWEIWWCVGDVVAMKYVVIRGRCGGVGVFGGVWELWWCMEDVVVNRRCNAHGWCGAL